MGRRGRSAPDRDRGDRPRQGNRNGVRPRTAWRLCVLAGLVAFACSWAFGRIPGLAACGMFDGSARLGPILAFELARTPGDVAALFGSGACRATLVGAQNSGLWLDALGFIP